MSAAAKTAKPTGLDPALKAAVEVARAAAVAEAEDAALVGEHLGVTAVRNPVAASPGQALPMVWDGQDATFELAQAGTYTFSLNVADPAAPLMTIPPSQ